MTRSGDLDGDGVSNRRESRQGTSITNRDTDGDGLEDGNDSSPRDSDSNNDGIAEEKYKQLLDAVKAGEYDEIIKKHLASIPPHGKRSKGGSGNG